MNSLNSHFPLCDLPGANTSSIHTAFMQQLAHSSPPLTRTQTTKIRTEHAHFIASGGAGGQWQTLNAAGLVVAIYYNHAATQGTQAGFEGKHLTAADANTFANQEIPFSNFCGCWAPQVSFCNAHLEGSLFTDAMLEQANFEGAILHNVDFSRANLSGTNFRNAQLQGADFENCNLAGADFTGADLRYTRFPGAHLAGVIY
jgi:uncharacterized protein YjbI with pentapeptide repeats